MTDQDDVNFKEIVSCLTYEFFEKDRAVFEYGKFLRGSL